MKALSAIATSVLLTFGAVAPSFAAPTQSATVQNQIDITRAVSIAQQNAQGRISSIDYDDDDAEYEVELASNNSKSEVKINARTGAVTGIEQERFDNDDITKYRALNSAKIELSQAMQIAARQTNGQVVEAEFDIENDTAIYEIKTIRNGQEYEVVVDANTGRVIQVESD